MDSPFTLEAAASTHTGLVRRSNQDTFGSDDQLQLYVVCDGMGGAAAGDIASQLATDTFLAVARQELLKLRDCDARCTEHALHRAAAAANRAVCDHAHRNPAYRGMGTTLVAACITRNTATLINIGDSRAYLLRYGNATRITQITEDHSYIAEQLRLGAITPHQAESSSWQSVITRAIGAAPDVTPDLFTLTLCPGDTLLLTSDGLTRNVTPDEIATVLNDSANLPAEAATEALIQLANARGGADNTTCLLLRAVAQESPASVALDSPSLCAR
jgi:protein phosphatase